MSSKKILTKRAHFSNFSRALTRELTFRIFLALYPKGLRRVSENSERLLALLVKIFLTIFIFFLAIMTQISFSYLFSFWQGNGPNPVLVLVLLLVILKGFGKNWWAIAALGLFMDFFSGLAFGTISFSLILCAFIIDWFNRKVFSEVKMETVASLIILGSLLYSFFLIGANALLSFIGRNETVSYFCYFKNCVFSSFPFLLAGLAVNLLFGEIIFYFLKRKLSR